MPAFQISRRVGTALTLAVLAGCSGTRLMQPLSPTEEDWPSFGRDAGRRGTAPRALSPPLERIWTADLNAGAGRGSPLIVNSTVIVGTLKGDLLLFSLLTGAKEGSIAFGDALVGSPAVAGSVVYTAASNTLESLSAYDLAAGRSLWKKAIGDVEVTPLVLGDRIYAGTTAGSFFCLDRETGEELWRFDLPENRTLKGIRSPASSDSSLILFGADDGILYALSPDSGNIIWTFPTGAPVVAAPAVDNGMAVACNLAGVVVAVDARTGQLRWKRPLQSPIYTPPTLTGTLAAVGTAGGGVFALRRSDGGIIWETAVGAPASGGLVASGDYLYGGTMGREVIALRRETGVIVWRDTVSGRIKGGAAIGRGRLAVACDDRLLIVYEEKTP